MSVQTLMTRPATVYRRTDSAPDEYGNPTLTEASGTPVLCQVARPSVRELTELTDTTIDDWLCFLPPGTAIAAGDRVEVDGLGSLEVVGRPNEVWHPLRGETHHIELRLQAVN